MKKLLLFMVLVLGMSSMTYAYFTSLDQKTNPLTIGYNTSKVEEVFPDPVIDPDDSKVKIVQVKNEDCVDCYVRVMAKLNDESLFDSITLDINEEEWKLEGDYYYYQDVVHVGEMTTPLFTTVTAKSNYNLEPFDIIVYEETVQAEGYANSIEAFKDIG